MRVGTNIRDCLREAIQTLSPAGACRHIFTHTGWRTIGDRWVSLTAAGALGTTDAGYEVDLGPELFLPYDVDST